jgi:hypothetical protein
MTEDEMTYVEGGWSYYWQNLGLNIKLTGAETKKLLEGMTNPIVAITGIASRGASIAATALIAVYWNIMNQYNKNNSGVTFYWSPLQLGMGVLNVPLIFDNY